MKETDDKAKRRLKGLSLFANVGIAEARPFNIGLHFGTRAAALSRIAYLHENGRARTPAAPPGIDLAALQSRFDRLAARWLAADDNPRFAADSYCVFSSRQVAVVSEEMVKYGSRSRRAA